MSEIDAQLRHELDRFRDDFERLRNEIATVIVGQRDVVDRVLVGLVAGGHVLLEGVPGLGKTLLVRTVAEAMDLRFNRIQFTPDLMPSDILGTNMVNEGPDGRRQFQFHQGPVFSNLLLADEINRATPTTQSALLEAMQERQVSMGGEVRPLPRPFFVLATQNPIDQEGTYPLPEAQLDRFFSKLIVRYPSAAELTEVLNRTTEGSTVTPVKVLDSATLADMQALVREVPVASHVKEYAVRLVLGSHPGTETGVPSVVRHLRFGSSPRGAQFLILAGKTRALVAGRFQVGLEDVADSVASVLRHRLILNYEAEADGVDADAVLKELVRSVPMRTGGVV